MRTNEPPVDACSPGAVPAGVFGDVAASNPHLGAIECLADLGLTTGTGPGAYEPSRPVTRGQFASLLARLADHVGAQFPTSSVVAFCDVDPIHQDAISRLASAGIATGVEERRFEPGAPITRGQAASMLHRAWPLLTGAPLPDGPDSFGDDDGSVHERAINALSAAGVVRGMGEGHFAPQDTTRRDHAASLVARVLALVT